MSQSISEKIDLKTAIIIGINTIVGAGIFSTTSLLGSKIGPAGIITFLLACIAVWFIAQSFARVAYLYPQEGSIYNYTKQWAGHTFAIFTAFSYVIGTLTAMGLLVKIASQYLHDIIPALSANIWSLIAIITLFMLNIAGAKLSKIGQYILIFATMYPLVITTILCTLNINLANLTPFMPGGLLSVISGTKVAIFGFFGFEGIASLFRIMHNPQESVPKALRITLICVSIIYLIFIGSILLGIPQEIFTHNPNISIPQALLVIYHHHTYLIQSIGISIIFSILATVHAVIWTGSEFLLSITKSIQNKTIKNLSTKNYLNQRNMVIASCIIITLACISIKNLSLFFSLADIFLLFAYICSISALLFIKEEWKSGQNYVTLIGLICATIIFSIALKTLLVHALL
ncbi:amino acid permease [Candidatus Dependentiae bacterium]|nr:amino acid permease [Candidatus Dependentiae bacterium]